MSDESERKDGMMTLEQVVEWFEGLAAAELDAEVAARSHPDEHVADAARLAVNRFFCGLTAQIFYRAPGSPPAQSEADVRQLVQRRRVLEASERQSAEGALWAVATTSTNAGSRSPFAVYYVQDVPQRGLQVIARYHVCSACHRTGKARGRACGECQGRGVCWRGGKKLPEDGDVLRVLRLEQAQAPG